MPDTQGNPTEEEKIAEPAALSAEEHQSAVSKRYGGTQPTLPSLGDKPTETQVETRKLTEENRQLKNQQVVESLLRSVESGLPEATEYQKQQISIEVMTVFDTIIKGKQMPSLESVISAVQKGVLTTQEKQSQADGGRELTIEQRSTSRGKQIRYARQWSLPKWITDC